MPFSRRQQGAPPGAPGDSQATGSSQAAVPGPGGPNLTTNPIASQAQRPANPPLYQSGRMQVQSGLEVVEERVDLDPSSGEYVVTTTYQMRVTPTRHPQVAIDQVVTPHIPPRAYGVTAEARHRYEQQLEAAYRPQVWYDSQITTAGYYPPTYGGTYFGPTGGAGGAAITVTGGMTAGTGAPYYWSDQYQYQSPQISEEERQRRARQIQKEKIAQQRATKRGRSLLLRCLNEEQQREYAHSRMFVVQAADGRVFRLRKHRTAELLGPDGQAVASYCIHLPGSYIPEDNLITQKLMLETDPARFEQIANVTPLRPSQQSPLVDYEQLRAQARPALTDAERARYLEEYYRDARAMLRAEGIADPDAWIAGVREQVRRHHLSDQVGAREAGGRGVAAQAIYADETFRADQAAETIGRMLADLDNLDTSQIPGQAIAA